VIRNSEWDDNKAGIVPNSLNNDDAPPPQDGACPNGATGPTGTHSCTVIEGNYVHDNNDPNVPGSGIAGSAPVGSGIEIAGGRNDTVVGNRVEHQGSWGIVVHDFPDTETPPPVSHCEGGTDLPGACYFPAFGNEVAGNRLRDNGFFGNPTNSDLAAATMLHDPGNCFHDNTDPNGVTSDPPDIQNPLVMGTCGVPNSGDTTVLAAELVCASSILGACPDVPGAAHYPTTTGVTMPAAPAQTTMPDPCAGVPPNAWCGGKG
jgi:hypothetical protein